MSTIAERYLDMHEPGDDLAHMRAIFGTVRDGQRWAVVTDGRVMICHHTESMHPPMEFDKSGIVDDCIGQGGEPIGSATVADLRAFCGPPYDGCDECDGTGKVPHDCDCEHCDLTGEEDCFDCGGKRLVEGYRPAWFGPLLMNQAVLARALSVLTDDGAVIRMGVGEGGGIRYGKLYLETEGVRMLVMGMRYMSGEACPRFPVGEDAPAEVEA